MGRRHRRIGSHPRSTDHEWVRTHRASVFGKLDQPELDGRVQRRVSEQLNVQRGLTPVRTRRWFPAIGTITVSTTLLFTAALTGCSSNGNRANQVAGSGNNIACQAGAVCLNGPEPTPQQATPTSSSPVTVVDENGIHWVNGQFSSSSGLIVNSTVKVGFGGCPGGSGYVYPSGSGITSSMAPGTGPQRNKQTWDQNPGAFGAIPASTVEMEISLTGPENHAVVITGLQFHVHSRKPAPAGVWLYVPGQCGGDSSYHYAKVDFDTAAPYYLPYSQPKNERADELRFPYTTSSIDLLSLQVVITSDHSDCTWDATLSWIDGGTTKSVTIDDNGKPFEITSVTGMTEKSWLPPAS